MRDTLTIGTIAGITGTVSMHILSMIEKLFGIVDLTTLQVSAALFLEWDQINTPAGLFVGVIAHLIVGSAGGVLLAYLIKISGKDYYWLKGLALAGFMLLLGMGFVIRVMDIVPQIRNNSMTALLHIINYSVYGLLASYVIAKYGKFKNIKRRLI